MRAEDDGKRGDGAVVVHAAVEQGALLFGFIDAVADHDKGAGQDLEVLGVAAGFFHAALDVGIELLAVGEAAAAGEHGLRGLGRELPAVFRCAGLHDHRPALHRAGDVEGAAHLQIFAVVVERVHLRGIDEQPTLDVAHEGIVGEGIPEAGDDVVELTRALVALGVLHVIVEAEVECGVGVRCGDDVPAGAAAAEMVERGEAAGDVIGLIKRGRAGRDQADPLGDGGERRQQGERLERGHGVAALERIDRHVQHGEVIGHEEGVELAGLELLDQRLDVAEVEIGVRPGPGIAPGAGMDADRAHERAKLELPLCHGALRPFWVSFKKT